MVGKLYFEVTTCVAALLALFVCGGTAFAQEASLGDLARQARQPKLAGQAAPASGQESLAEQARKALQQAPAPISSNAAADSLAEQARQISYQRNFQKFLGQLRHRPLPYLEIAVAPPLGTQPSRVEVARKPRDRGATPAGQGFSLSQVLHSRSRQSRDDVARISGPSAPAPTPAVSPATPADTPPPSGAQMASAQHPADKPAPAVHQEVLTPTPELPTAAKVEQPIVPAEQVPAARIQSAAGLSAPQPPVGATPLAAVPPPPQVDPIPLATVPTQPQDTSTLPQPDAVPVHAAVNIQTEFKVKYVGQDVVYLSSGRSAGLAEGMKLAIKRPADGTTPSAAPVIAELEVASVAASSAVCEVKTTASDLHAGDIAYLSEADAELLAQTRAVGGSRKYPQVIAFTEGGDPLDEEARDELPRPPLQEINRARGRIGLDYSGISSRGSITSSTNQIGGVVRADITRIGGTYWGLSGYWRGRFSNSSYDGQATLQDLLNRTYHLSLTYDNPKGAWVAGFGRLYLPWATSLDTLDGGYVGRRLGHGTTAGVFAGSTPDPTSWDYNPDRRIAGTFINFEGGSFDKIRYTSTSGIALSTLGWISDRPFVFFENGIFFKRYLSIYESAQADDPRPAPGVTAAGPGLSRSYVTVRFQPHRRIAFDLNHNYFRDVPTFSQQLIATGLVDKYLFQGFSAGVRVEPVRHVTLYTDLGLSNRSGDMKNSINQLYGITWDHIWKTGLRADLRASKFDSSFGSGTYRSVGLARNFGERLHWQVQAGKQNLTSSLTSQGQSTFVNSSLDSTFGRHYFLQADYTTQRGVMYDYDQWILTFGYRFDNRSKIGGGQ
ncbi:MAG TPA: hypothetical protein VFI82_11695 [Terriglobales bacterium]|nr:hypothetical protein [Terriglobales bacterium]